ELDIESKLPLRLEQQAKGSDVDQMLDLVVSSAAPVEAVIFLHQLKWMQACAPTMRFAIADIPMAVNKDGWQSRVLKISRDHQRRTVRLRIIVDRRIEPIASKQRADVVCQIGAHHKHHDGKPFQSNHRYFPSALSGFGFVLRLPFLLGGSH